MDTALTLKGNTMSLCYILQIATKENTGSTVKKTAGNAKSNQTASLRTELVLVDAKHGTLQMSAKLALVRMIAQITNFKFIHCLDIYLFSKYRTKTLNMISIFSLKTANI